MPASLSWCWLLVAIRAENLYSVMLVVNAFDQIIRVVGLMHLRLQNTVPTSS